MTQRQFDLLGPDTPLAFADGTAIYDKLAETYKTHESGLFILGPSGSGKTHFVKNDIEPNWIDGDILWMSTKAHPDSAWWRYTLEEIRYIDARSDVITHEAKRLGFWVLGASNLWLRPDAVVLPDWETHKQWILHREQTNYDGGATMDALDSVLVHREIIQGWIDKGVLQFETVADAVQYLTSR